MVVMLILSVTIVCVGTVNLTQGVYCAVCDVCSHVLVWNDELRLLTCQLQYSCCGMESGHTSRREYCVPSLMMKVQGISSLVYRLIDPANSYTCNLTKDFDSKHTVLGGH